jgi:hypothetical protein
MSHSKSSHIVGLLQSCSTYVDQDIQLVLVLHRTNSLLRQNKSTITQFPFFSRYSKLSNCGQLMTTISDLTIILFGLQKMMVTASVDITSTESLLPTFLHRIMVAMFYTYNYCAHLLSEVLNYYSCLSSCDIGAHRLLLHGEGEVPARHAHRLEAHSAKAPSWTKGDTNLNLTTIFCIKINRDSTQGTPNLQTVASILILCSFRLSVLPIHKSNL